jgi:hypothetical protein
MKSKIFVVLFAVVLLAGSLAIAGDQKPFKGWGHEVAFQMVWPIDVTGHDYFQQVIDDRGEPPAGMYLSSYLGVNNVGGASIIDVPGILYYDFSSPLLTFDVYEEETITVANGDKIFLTVVGKLRVDPVTLATIDFEATDTVVGGTGRFEGAEGLIEVSPGLDSQGLSIAVFDGHITTVGEAKKQ